VLAGAKCPHAVRRYRLDSDRLRNRSIRWGLVENVMHNRASFRSAIAEEGIVRTLVAGIAMAMAIPAAGVAAAVVPLDSYAVEVDVDGDGQVDRLGVTNAQDGRQTRLEVVSAAGGSAVAKLPWRGEDTATPAGGRFEGVSPLRVTDQSDVVVRTTDGQCNSYRVMRWDDGDLRSVPRPGGGKNWKVCALGVTDTGLGYRVKVGKQRTTVITYRATAAGTSQRVQLRTTRYRWKNDDWRKLNRKKSDVAPQSLLGHWGLDFPWRSN
jgi:hypothetical protein